MVTYPMIDSMNGMYEWRSQGGGGLLAASYSIKNLNQIKKPSSRLVFLDEGKLSPDSFAVYIDRECWFDQPMTRHGMGTCMSFADGHSGRWMWRSKRTVEIGQLPIPYCMAATDPAAAKQDLYKMQLACWGKLLYNPSIPVKIDDQ